LNETRRVEKRAEGQPDHLRNDTGVKRLEMRGGLPCLNSTSIPLRWPVGGFVLPIVGSKKSGVSSSGQHRFS
jgi:hypothetical protein